MHIVIFQCHKHVVLYSLYRKDREGRLGVCLYVKNDLLVNMRDDIANGEEGLEILVAEGKKQMRNE